MSPLTKVHVGEMSDTAYERFLRREGISGMAAAAMDGVRRRQRHLIENGTWDPDCTYCRQHTPGEMMPSHTASPRCQSGGRNHCTCDTCF